MTPLCVASVTARTLEGLGDSGCAVQRAGARGGVLSAAGAAGWRPGSRTARWGKPAADGIGGAELRSHIGALKAGLKCMLQRHVHLVPDPTDPLYVQLCIRLQLVHLAKSATDTLHWRWWEQEALYTAGKPWLKPRRCMSSDLLHTA